MDSVVTSPQRPMVVMPGAPALKAGVERYVVKGGGSGVFALERDDTIEIVPLEGGQLVEIAAFGRGGGDDLPALGLKKHGKPTGIQRILASDSEDAVRVRFGLFRRDLDIARVDAATLFDKRCASRRERNAQGRASRHCRHRRSVRDYAGLGADAAKRRAGVHSPS